MPDSQLNGSHTQSARLQKFKQTLQENLVFLGFGFATICSNIATITFCGNLKTCYKVATDTALQMAIVANCHLSLNIKLLWQSLIRHNYEIATLGNTL